MFIEEVELFNKITKKPNNYTPNIPDNKGDWMFVYNFILEELEEYKHACETGNLVEVGDALGDIMYVLCNGIMLHGMKGIFNDIYNEIQRSNLTKTSKTLEDAEKSLIKVEKEKGWKCHIEEVDGYYVVYRTEDRKVMKGINFEAPNLAPIINK